MTEKLRRLIKSIPDLLRSRRREVEFLALGVFLVGVGVLASLILSKSDNQGIEIIGAGGGGENSRPRETGQEDLLADVAGAVIHPGVYRLPASSRFADALAAAGGLSASADRDWVSRHLNLAQSVTDGVKIYIPEVGENKSGTPSGNGQRDSSSRPGVGTQNDGVSINSATLTELDTLWGVGEARAKAIIEGRPYGSIEELVTRKIVPSNVVEKNRDRLRF